jgi:hypothetical protein
MTLLYDMTSDFVRGLAGAGAIGTTAPTHPHLRTFIQQMDGRANEEPDPRNISHGLWYAHDHVMRTSSLPAFWRYLGKKRPKDSEYQTAIKLLCLQLERISAFQADAASPTPIRQYVARVERSHVSHISIQPRPYGSLDYSPSGLTMEGATRWLSGEVSLFTTEGTITEARAHELNCSTIYRLARVMIEAENAHPTGTLTVQIDRPSVRTCYAPLDGSAPVIRAFTF